MDNTINVPYTYNMLPEDPIVEPKRVLKATIKNFNGVTIKGEKGDTGEKGEKGERGATGPQGPQGKQGDIGKQGLKGEKGDRGENGINGKDGEDGSPDTPDQIAEKLNTLEAQVDLKVLKGWKEFLANLGEKGSATRVYGSRMLRNLVDVIGAKDATTGQVLTKQADGTFGFETPSGGGGGSLTKGIVEVDFGANTTQSDIATVSVADATVTSTSYPSVCMYAVATTDHDPDDYMVEGLIPYVTNVQNGVGFDISVRAPNMTFGKYKCTYQF